VFSGLDQPNPDFSGAGSFSIDPSAPLDSVLAGSISQGHFEGGPGTARIELVVLGVPVLLDLIGARISADVSVSGCENAKLGGAITQTQVHSSLFPALATGINSKIAADPGCPADCSPDVQTLLDLFDTDHDVFITVAEIESNSLIQALFAPDVDLLDANGAFNPRVDGVSDSLSIGVGFSCAGATF
jgi:hypothetical protein